MTRQPIELKKDIILEAIFELRFEPEAPTDAVLGMIYPHVKSLFPNMLVKPLPLRDVPDTIRNADINLKYQPISRFEQNGMSVSIGPRVISFSVVRPYLGWSKWHPYITDLLYTISENKVVKTIERTGLRYINFLDIDVFSVINADINIISSQVHRVATAIKTEIIEGEYVKTLQLFNNVKISGSNKEQNGSLIDIDVCRNKKMSGSDFKYNLEDILNKSHLIEKQLFFDILKKDFLESLEPVYRDEENG